ncbi:MAG: CofH family radical SAM protein [bacterium]
MAGLSDPLLNDAALLPVWHKVRRGERLAFADGMAMLTTPDLPGLGQMADWANRRRNGDRVFFTFNRQLNPSNVCVYSCKFCEFAAKPGSPYAYELSLEQCLATLSDELSEVHIVGGLHPEWEWERYTGLLAAIRARFPKITIKAWTAVEIEYFAHKFRKTRRAVLQNLKDSGLDTLPGGGAEVFSERVRTLLFPQKIGYGEWREIHLLAHSMGIRSNVTMLYGHIETLEERVDHMLKVRDMQDVSGGFDSFIPLAFQPGMTGITPLRASAVDDLRTVSCSRLLLDNVNHVKAYWVMLGEETASIALAFGASDLDGTIGEEKVAHSALAGSPVGLARERLVKLIREAGKLPVERDARYRVLREYGRTGESAASAYQVSAGAPA